jgi:hypothetical protein
LLLLPLSQHPAEGTHCSAAPDLLLLLLLLLLACCRRQQRCPLPQVLGSWGK